MRNLVYLLCIFSCVTARSQSLDAGKVKLSIVQDSLVTTWDEPTINLDFGIKNCSNSNLILYEFNSTIIRDGLGTLAPYCDQEKTSAAVILYITDSISKPVTAIHWYVNDLRNPMTKNRLDSIMTVHKDTYLHRAVILDAFNRECFTQEIDLQEFHLQKGQYFVQLLYFSGKRIRNFVTNDDMRKDKRRFNAEIFQGCVVSNKSVLLIK